MIGIKQKYQDLFFQTEQTVNRKKSGFRAAPFLAAFSRILEILFQILQNPNIFISFILKIDPFLHVYCKKIIKNIYFFTNFEFSQKFPVKSQNFLHIDIVPMMYE
jgi:hypothetical protein